MRCMYCRECIQFELWSKTELWGVCPKFVKGGWGTEDCGPGFRGNPDKSPIVVGEILFHYY